MGPVQRSVVKVRAPLAAVHRRVTAVCTLVGRVRGPGVVARGLGRAVRRRVAWGRRGVTAARRACQPLRGKDRAGARVCGPVHARRAPWRAQGEPACRLLPLVRGLVASVRGLVASARGPLLSARGPVATARGPVASARGCAQLEQRHDAAYTVGDHGTVAEEGARNSSLPSSSAKR